MKETRLAQQVSADVTEQDRPSRPTDNRPEIRLLADYELALAGGGEQDVNWP